MSVALLCAAPAPVAAQAQEGGEWEVLLEVEAKGEMLTKNGSEMKKEPWKNEHNHPVPTGEWEGWRNSGYDSGSGFDAHGINGKKAALIGGETKYFINLRWKPWDTDNPAPAPQKGAVLLQTQVYISGDATGPVNIRVSDASGSKPASRKGNYIDRDGDQHYWKHLQVNGKKLIPFSNSEGETEQRLGPFITTLSGDVLSPGVTIPTPPGEPVQKRYPKSQIDSNVSAWVKLDSRSVTLSRPSAINQWQTNEDGVLVTHGDTTYSFMRDQLGPAYPETNSQTFNVGYSGNWSTTFANLSYNTTWNWTTSGLTTEMKMQQKTRLSMPLGDLTDTSSVLASQRHWEGTPKDPQEVTIKYFARDKVDDAQAEARYALTIHEPVELVGGKQLVKRYNVTTPAYFEDPADGKWKLVAALNGDETHTYQPGEYSYTVNRGAAKARGYTVGFQGGVGLGVEAVIGYNHSEEMSWYKEMGGTATLSEVIGPGEAAYLEVVFPRQVLKQDFRLFTPAGEIRSSESPAVPAPSIPHSMRWEEEESAATQRWMKVGKDEIVPTNQSELPTAQGNSSGES